MESLQKISDQVLKTYQTTQRLKNIIYLNPNPNRTIGSFFWGGGLIIVWCSLLWDWHPIWEVPDLIPPNPVLLTRYAVWRNRVDFCSSFCFVMIFLWYQKVLLHHTKTDVNVVNFKRVKAYIVGHIRVKSMLFLKCSCLQSEFTTGLILWGNQNNCLQLEFTTGLIFLWGNQNKG